MADQKEMRSGTYRCPVCGHSDSVEMTVEKESLVTPCSNCDTLLEVAFRGEDSIRFRVQVAEEAGD